MFDFPSTFGFPWMSEFLLGFLAASAATLKLPCCGLLTGPLKILPMVWSKYGLIFVVCFWRATASIVFGSLWYCKLLRQRPANPRNYATASVAVKLALKSEVANEKTTIHIKLGRQFLPHIKLGRQFLPHAI